MSPAQSNRLEMLRRWAILLDSAFRVPGTSIRFGLDAIVGLIPGVGDLASPVYTAAILVEGFRRRVPAVVQARMVLNAAIDMGLGLVPILGDLVDVAWRANLKNLDLLERHADRRVRAGIGDYLFVGACLALVVAIAVIPIVLIVWLLSRVRLV
jgi:hypothetical protein